MVVDSEMIKPDPLGQYNVAWNTPSHNSIGSMPIGNGDIGLNVWVEVGGELVFYISKTDAWTGEDRWLLNEISRSTMMVSKTDAWPGEDAWVREPSLPKLGRVRIEISPNPFFKKPFRQALKLRQGEVEILAGEKDSEVALKIWVDANQPVIRVEADGKKDFDMRVRIEGWRDDHTVYPSNDDRIIWFHRNRTSHWPKTMELQGLESLMKELSDPLLNRTFGGAIEGDDLVKEGPSTMGSLKPQRRYTISIYVLTKQTPTVEEWLEHLDKLIARVRKKGIGPAREEHHKWWDEFWNRSWIRLGGSEKAWAVGRGYMLQRFMNACGGRGDFPIKFNGSIFTFDCLNIFNEREIEHADDRAWGSAYWFQNTRLVYWPMLASGDFDLMQPFFRMYREALPLAEYRTRLYFGHDGAFFPETMYFWGTYTNAPYGLNREGKAISYVENPWIRYYYSGGLELTAMMLDYYGYTQDRKFFKSTLFPLAQSITQFYDQHYERGENGKILFKPAGALETWHRAVNPMPEIAGLRFVLAGLLSLPSDLIGTPQRATWQRLLEELPDLPKKQEDGKALLLPAEEFSDRNNCENCELYAVFPYRLYGVGKPDLETGRYTFEKRIFDGWACWRQDPIQAAYLGLTDVARQKIVTWFPIEVRGVRFPAFWTGISDWIPDQDHGGVGMMTLETMLLQAEGKKILLFPAWPKEWDVEFKLHAPLNTVVEGVYRAGKLEELKVTPESRARDLVNMMACRVGSSEYETN